MKGAQLGHYEIVGRLGRGGMGDVFVARDRKLGREVALKLLPPELATDAERRKRFEREARAAAAVTHANIATIYEVGEHDGQIFIAMEYVRGQSLRQRLGRPVPVDEALAIATQIARGLSKAHASNVIHRDLKPENVMLDEEGGVRVLDFGLAKLGNEVAGWPEAVSELAETESALLTEAGQVLGTPGYMSPEQAAGRPVDHRSDLFSLGVVIYEMLTGRRPFAGDSLMEVVAATLRDEPACASQVNAAVPPQLDALLARCLAKDPQTRIQTADELRAALDALDESVAVARLAPASSGPAPAAPTGAGEASTDLDRGYDQFEVRVFALARDGIELTLPNVVAELGLAPQRAERWLDRMAGEGRLRRRAAAADDAAGYEVPGLTVRPPAATRMTFARRVVARWLKLDRTIPPVLPPAKQKSVLVGAVIGGLLPGVGLLYAAPVVTTLLVTIVGSAAVGLSDEVPIVGDIPAVSALVRAVATLLFALLSALLGGTYAWHYNRHGKRVPLRLVDYTEYGAS